MDINTLFIPLIVLLIVLYAIIKKVSIYDSFIEGCKEGLTMSISIFPFLIAMIFAVNLLLKSGLVNDFFSIFKPIFSLLNFPIEVLPLALIRPISGNASFVVMIDLIKQFGTDSTIGRIASIMQGATDTTIYVLSLYFGSIGIKNIKYALKAGLFADLIAIIMSILLVYLFF